MAELSRHEVEQYLKAHPTFVRKYYLEHIGREKLQAWNDEENLAKTASRLRLDTRHNSITKTTFQNLISGRRTRQAIQRRCKDELMQMNEIDRFMELIRDVANELDVNLLCYKILLNVKILTHSDRGSLFLVRGSGNNKFLVSKLFDVSEESSLQESLHTEETHIRVPFGKGIAGTVALTKTSINISDAYQDPRFNNEVDTQTGYRTKHLLCMPIVNYDGDVVGVAQIINKKTGDEFTKEDEEVFRNYLTFCGIGLTNAQLFEMSVLEYQRNQMLLNLARSIFAEQCNLDSLVQQIMLESQEILKCRRCCVYLVDSSAPNTSFEKAFELNDDSDKISILSKVDVRRSKSAELALEVAISGQIKNISDTRTDLLNGHELLDHDGYSVVNLMSLPIRNSDRTILGVVQLMNKSNHKPFTDMDVNIVEAFAIFCGLGIHNCQMYESACKLMAKQKVALEVLSYHATAPQEDVEKLKNAPIPQGSELKLYKYDFNDMLLNEDETCKATIRMFLDMNIVEKFNISYEVLCRWILSVKKNYRPVTYHNWRHAFNVTQTMFTMLYTGNMVRYMDDLEMFALVVACLCHDLDHRGTNNAFQSKAESPLALLYSTSTMEHHHFDQCIMILNSEGNNIFTNLNGDDYKRLISLLENAILATDLALYFRKMSSFESLVTSGHASWKEPHEKDLLRSMMMTACDVAAITKPWEVQQEVAHLVASEFFEQGDLERNKLNQEPIAMMDRRKKEELPKMQVGFIDTICMPIYKLLAEHFEGLKPLYDGVVNNRKQWNELCKETPAKSVIAEPRQRPSDARVNTVD